MGVLMYKDTVHHHSLINLYKTYCTLQLILPVSSWAFWGGLLSNATEIHVNAPPHHSVMYGMNNYIYHNEKTKEYFGSYNAKENDIIYRTNLTNHHHNKLKAKSVMKTHSSGGSVSDSYVENKTNGTNSNSTSAGVGSSVGTGTTVSGGGGATANSGIFFF